MERFLDGNTLCREKYTAVLGNEAEIQNCFSADSAIGRIVSQLFAAMEKKQTGYEWIATGLLWQFFGTILEQRLYTRPTKEQQRGKRTAQMKRVLRRIRQDYATELTLADLAAEAAMAPQYFCHVFRQVTGRTPMDYLNYYRIECAAELLCVSEDSVTDIALSCGFNDLSYFIKLFKRHKGVSARVYRKQREAQCQRR